MAGLVSGLRDPVTRPRYIVMTGVTLLVGTSVFLLAMGMTSTRSFCAQVCHKVQDDTITAYANSSHAEVSCLACHEPVNADPATFVLAKVKTMPELYQAVSNTFKLPLNEGSALALNAGEMPAAQCTQCHAGKRIVTPRHGLIVDHAAHAKAGIACTVCHNRVAHNEQGWSLTLTGPDGAPNVRHAVFTQMTACFRCHDLSGHKDAPGKCSTCHTADHTLKPKSHQAADWPKTGHAKASMANDKAVADGAEVSAELIAEGVDKRLAQPVSYCSTCHIQSEFCVGCHGMQVPHMADFESRTHPLVAREQFAKCVLCHGDPAVTGYCDGCHHGTRIGWAYDKKVPWLQQHGEAANKVGASACYEICHHRDSCYSCHPKGKVFTKV